MNLNRWWRRWTKRPEPAAETAAGERDPDGMDDTEMERIAGGLVTVRIPLCNLCRQRTSVSGMKICAECFRKLNASDGGGAE